MTYVKILGVLALVGILATGAFLIKGLIDDNATLTASLETTKQALATEIQSTKMATDRIDRLNEDRTKFNQDLDRIGQQAQEARAEVARLQQVFARHNLEELANAKPNLVERRLNDGTADAFRLLNDAAAGRRPAPGTPKVPVPPPTPPSRAGANPG